MRLCPDIVNVEQGVIPLRIPNDDNLTLLWKNSPRAEIKDRAVANLINACHQRRERHSINIGWIVIHMDAGCAAGRPRNRET